MSRRDPKDPRTLTTVRGVKVIVNPKPDPPPPEPRREPPPEEIPPRVIIVPEGLSDEELSAWLSTLARENQALVDKLLARRLDVLPESRLDLRQNVLVILCNHVATTREVPLYLSTWLENVINKTVRNHKDLKRVPVEHGADAEAVPCGSDKDPEGAVDRARRSAKLSRCLRLMPADQAAVVRCVKLFDMTLEQTAKAIKKPLSTVHYLAGKATEELERLMHCLPDDEEEDEGA